MLFIPLCLWQQQKSKLNTAPNCGGVKVGSSNSQSCDIYSQEYREMNVYASCLLPGAYLYFSTHFRTPCLGNSVAHTGLGLPMSSNLDNPLQTFEKANPMQIILHWYSLLRWFGWLSSQQLKSTITKVLPHESST